MLPGGGGPWAAKGVTSSAEQMAGAHQGYAVDRIHENGQYWVEQAVYPSKYLAKAAIEELIASGIPAKELRVRKSDPHE
jgi:hypothetical protein